MSLLTGLLTLLLLSVLVIVHELGHFWAARLLGVRVLEFSVGIGPVLARTMRRGIQYSLRWIPLGGFVKLAGMESPIEGGSAAGETDDEGSLRYQPAWKKILIVLAGPVSNIIFAAFTFVVMFAAVGVPQKADPRAIIGNIEPKTPAYEAGLSPGDRIIAVNGRRVELWTELAERITASKGADITLTVRRGGRVFARRAKPFLDPRLGTYRLGIIPKYYFTRLGLKKSLVYGIKSVYYGSYAVVRLVVRAIKGQERMALSGPIGAFGAVDQSLKAGPGWVLDLMASIGLFLALFNLIPIPLPLLDGGWVAVYLCEAVRRREFTVEEKAAAQFFGLMVMAVFFIFITYADLRTTIRRFINR
ncbi:MAG: M50 family metallopeptidase [Patescibacteria group bacterium]